jgi:hypothetical protein
VCRLVHVQGTSFAVSVESVAVFILANLRLSTRNFLLVYPDVFSLILICCSREFSDDGDSLISLIFIRARVVIIFSFIRCCEMS